MAGIGGFTLIEILVVLAIVGVMVLTVSLSVDTGGASRRVDVEATRLAQLMQLACDESAQSGQDVGVRFRADGYRFLRARGREWEPRGSDALRARKLPDGMHIAVRIADREIELDTAAPSRGDATADETAGDSTQPSAQDAALIPHLACDVEGAVNVDARIELRAGARAANLSVDEQGALRVELAEASS